MGLSSTTDECSGTKDLLIHHVSQAFQHISIFPWEYEEWKGEFGNQIYASA